MKVRFIELAEPLREGGLEKAAADMARYLNEDGGGVEVFRGDGPVDRFGSPDLVHFHGLWSPTHLRHASWCRKRGIPHLVSPHGMLEPWAWKHRRWKKWPYFHLFEKRRLQAAGSILATATAEADNLKAFFPTSRIDVLSLGIEPDVFPDFEGARKKLGWSPEERVLLYLSRVHPKKGLLELLEAIDQLPPDSGKMLRLVILGNGPADYEEQCRAMVKRVQKQARVEWLPPQWGDAKWQYLQGADLFCLPTYSENFGIVILEAGIVGTPIFTTTGTPWKHVGEAGFGWVVEPDPAGYPQVLKAFLATPLEEHRNLRQPFAQWTRQHYAWPSLVEGYKRLYNSIAEENKR